MVSLEISSCWEMYSSCAWTQSVLDYARFKKQTCASQMAYQSTGTYVLKLIHQNFNAVKIVSVF